MLSQRCYVRESAPVQSDVVKVRSAILFALLVVSVAASTRVAHATDFNLDYPPVSSGACNMYGGAALVVEGPPGINSLQPSGAGGCGGRPYYLSFGGTSCPAVWDPSYVYCPIAAGSPNERILVNWVCMGTTGDCITPSQALHLGVSVNVDHAKIVSAFLFNNPMGVACNQTAHLTTAHCSSDPYSVCPVSKSTRLHTEADIVQYSSLSATQWQVHADGKSLSVTNGFAWPPGACAASVYVGHFEFEYYADRQPLRTLNADSVRVPIERVIAELSPQRLVCYDSIYVTAGITEPPRGANFVVVHITQDTTARLNSPAAGQVWIQETITGRVAIGCPAPAAEQGARYQSLVTASGGREPFVFSIAGALPPGLSLESGTGAITGIPTLAGTFSFFIQATDADGIVGTKECSIRVAQASLDCSRAVASPSTLFKHDHKLQRIRIRGITGATGPVAVAVTGVTQDEPLVSRDCEGDEADDRSIDDPEATVDDEAPSLSLEGTGGGNDLEHGGRGHFKRCPDAVIDAHGHVSVRRERLNHGNGRVYVISFTASDTSGHTCSGTVDVCVPGSRQHHRRQAGRHDCSVCIDDGQTVNSLGPCPGRSGHDEGMVAAEVRVTASSGARAHTSIEFTLMAGSKVRVQLYDVAGRRVATIFDGWQDEGPHRLDWDARKLERGMYFCRIEAGDVVATKSLLLLK